MEMQDTLIFSARNLYQNNTMLNPTEKSVGIFFLFGKISIFFEKNEKNSKNIFHFEKKSGIISKLEIEKP